MAIILALAACLVASTLTPASATGVNEQKKPNPEIPGGNENGDPDLPVGPTRGMQVRVQRGTPDSRIMIAGDDRVPGGVWEWRIRIALLSLRAFILRF